MLLDERTMKAGFTTNAHSSRVLEYTWNGLSWVQLTPNKYSVAPITGLGDSAAGGCDYDWGSPGLMWTTADHLHFIPPDADYIYGLQGTPTSGPGPFDVTTSLLIDSDNETTTGDKYYQGDVEIPCPGATSTGCSAVAERITCNTHGGGYLLALNVTNNTGQPITSVLVTPPTGYTVTPGNPPIPGGSLADQHSTNLVVTITGGHPGDKPCFTVTFMTQSGCQCKTQVCPTLPIVAQF